ncbi:MAG: DNA repair protein RecO [Legionella sp.]|jgi:DNA repair protein RecO (recombination protein O)|nr:DNA repair protein RecO [Legionella sp.]
MITDGLSAWLLHQRLAKNSTTQVFFLTRERGLVRAYCQGGRSLKKRAVLQPFTPLWLSINERSYGTYVKQVEIAQGSEYLHGEILLAGMYINEVLYRALKPDVPEPMLYETYEYAIRALVRCTQRMQLEIILRKFERNLIHLSGYQISYTEEADTARPILDDKYYTFVPGEGFVLAKSHHANQGYLGAHILSIAADVWTDAEVLKTAKHMMRRGIHHLLDGAVIETRALYQQG